MTAKTKQKISASSKGRVQSKEERLNRSISMKKAVREHPDSYSISNVSGRTPILEYNGIKVKGTWELKVAKWLDARKIKWTNKIKGIEYNWNGKIHLYFPDFYLQDLDIYIEVKGYERDRDKAKWQSLDNLIIIKKNRINNLDAIKL